MSIRLGVTSIVIAAAASSGLIGAPHSVGQSMEVTPLPSDASSVGGVPKGAVEAVACPSPGNCTEVGYYPPTGGGADAPFIAQQVGGAWQTPAETIELPTAPAGSDGSLLDVACGSASQCIAVGSYFSHGDTAIPEPLLVAVSGGTPNQGETIPLPRGARASWGGELELASCAGAGNCVALGYATTTDGIFTPMALQEIGGTWRTASEFLPLPSGVTATSLPARIASLTCATATYCVAVGQFAKGKKVEPVVDVLSGTTWKNLPVPQLKGSTPYGAMTAAECPAASSCIAIGDEEAASGTYLPFLMVMTGGKWSKPVLTPLPPGSIMKGEVPRLFGLACASVGHCTATGSYVTTAKQLRLVALRDNGGKLSATALPTPPGAITNASKGTLSLPDLSCAGTTCVALGVYSVATASVRPFLEVAQNGRWDSSSLAVPSPPAIPASGFEELPVAAICASTTRCSAFGTAINDKNFAEEPIVDDVTI